MRASTSRSSLYTENDARAVAPTPSRRMSGCAQWCPARMQTPRASRIDARSCGCTSARVKLTTAPRSAPRGGPKTRDAGERAAAARRRARASAALVGVHLVHPERVEVVGGRGEPDRAFDVRRARPRTCAAARSRCCGRRGRTRSCRRRSARAASPRAARGGRRARRRPSARASCGRRRRRSPRRARRCASGRCGAACAPSHTVIASGAASRTIAAISLTGFTAPSTFDTWLNATTVVRGPSIARSATRSTVPSAASGAIDEGAVPFERELLPGDEVAVVLGGGDDDLVAGAEVGAPPGCRRRGSATRCSRA